MDRHMEESVQQHLMLMCSLVTKQQNQITTLKNALSRISLHQSGINHFRNFSTTLTYFSYTGTNYLFRSKRRIKRPHIFSKYFSSIRIKRISNIKLSKFKILPVGGE